MGNENKAATLGMPIGTATHRLRKNFLFHVLKKHGENVCARCEKVIESVDDLSIEHIKPWEGISAELFWDLENIGVSHLHCNVPHTRRGGEPSRKIGPIGTAWCAAHQVFEPIKNFWKESRRWNGLTMYCKETKHLSRQV
jgi:hypothetical protein